MAKRVYTIPKTTEQNLIVLSGKSEATITNSKRLRSTGFRNPGRYPKNPTGFFPGKPTLKKEKNPPQI